MEQPTKVIEQPNQVTIGACGVNITIEPYSEWVHNLLRSEKIVAGCTEGNEDILEVPLPRAQDAIRLLTAKGTQCAVMPEARKLIDECVARNN